MIRTAAIAALLLAAGSASAQTVSQRASVSYADLDLANSAGRATLERRLDQAVSEVCAVGQGRRTLDEAKGDQTCMTAAWAGARRQLAALYEGKIRLADARVQVTPSGSR